MPRKPKAPKAQESPQNASDAVSREDTPKDTKDQDNAAGQPADGQKQGSQATGDAPQAPPADHAAATAARVRVRDRLMKHPEWKMIITSVREMRADPKLASMTAEARERFIWSEMDRLYPLPPPETTKIAEKTPDNFAIIAKSGSDLSGGSRIQGLAEIPADWPELVSNASLGAEIAWVQAERLRIVEEKPGGSTLVTLSKARAPAPSWAALSWLETSIRSYAKFVEVAAKAAGEVGDEQALVRRERMQLDEIRALLAEMKDAGKQR